MLIIKGNILKNNVNTGKPDGTILLLDDEDCLFTPTSCACRGYTFDTILVPKKMKEIFKKTLVYTVVYPTLKSNGKIIFY